jgi:hypothetical protein
VFVYIKVVHRTRARSGLQGWRSVQRLTPEGAVESEQCVELGRLAVAHSAAGARDLGRRYWYEVERSTFGIVRARPVDEHERVALRVLGRRPALLEFAAAEIVVSDDEVTCHYPIRGGLLARGPRGALALTQRREPRLGLRSTITGFYPRLAARPGRPGWSRPLYALVQHRFHVWISRRFFQALAEGRRR